GVPVGNTHASQVVLPVPVSATGRPRSTKSVPSKDRASPYLPLVVHAAPWIVPVRPLPEASAVVVPRPSFMPYPAARPLFPLSAVAVATFENALAVPAVSIAWI